MKNGYLQKKEADLQAAFVHGQRLGFQRACDCLAMALNDSDCMGKSVMSGERINKIFEYAIMLDNAYDRAFIPKDPEADYYQEKIDERQKRIFKDRFVPFKRRYPYIRDCKYR